MYSVNFLKFAIFIISIYSIKSDDSSQIIRQFSTQKDSFTLAKKLNEFFFNSSFYRVDDFTTSFNNFHDANFTMNSTFFKEKLKLFQIDLVKRRNSLCLFEIHKRFDWSFIKFSNVLDNTTKYDINDVQKNNDSYFSGLIKNMDETVSQKNFLEKK
jgi:hypothetical protein